MCSRRQKERELDAFDQSLCIAYCLYAVRFFCLACMSFGQGGPCIRRLLLCVRVLWSCVMAHSLQTVSCSQGERVHPQEADFAEEGGWELVAFGGVRRCPRLAMQSSGRTSI